MLADTAADPPRGKGASRGVVGMQTDSASDTPGISSEQNEATSDRRQGAVGASRGGSNAARVAERAGHAARESRSNDRLASIPMSVHDMVVSIDKTTQDAIAKNSSEILKNTRQIYLQHGFEFSWRWVQLCASLPSAPQNAAVQLWIIEEVRRNISKARHDVKDGLNRLILSFTWAVHVYGSSDGEAFFRNEATCANISNLWCLFFTEFEKIPDVVSRSVKIQSINLVLDQIANCKVEHVIEYSMTQSLKQHSLPGYHHHRWMDPIRRLVFHSLTFNLGEVPYETFELLCRGFGGFQAGVSDTFRFSPFYYVIEHRLEYLNPDLQNGSYKDTKLLTAQKIINNPAYPRDTTDLQEMSLHTGKIGSGEEYNFVSFLAEEAGKAGKFGFPRGPTWNPPELEEAGEAGEAGESEGPRGPTWRKTDLRITSHVKRYLEALPENALDDSFLWDVAIKPKKADTAAEIIKTAKFAPNPTNSDSKNVFVRFFSRYGVYLYFGASLAVTWMHSVEEGYFAAKMHNSSLHGSTWFDTALKLFYGLATPAQLTTFGETVKVIVDVGTYVTISRCAWWVTGRLYAMCGGWWPFLMDLACRESIVNITALLIFELAHGTFATFVGKLFSCLLFSGSFNDFAQLKGLIGEMLFGKSLEGVTIGWFYPVASVTRSLAEKIATHFVIKGVVQAASALSGLILGNPLTFAGIAVAGVVAYGIYKHVSWQTKLKARKIRALAMARKDDIVDLALFQCIANKNVTIGSVSAEAQKIISSAIGFCESGELETGASEERKKFWIAFRAELNASLTPPTAQEGQVEEEGRE
jgi:hypothetical protein